MKFFPFKLSRSQGYALLMVLTIVGVAALVAGSTIRRTYTVAALNERAKQYQSSMYAAEAAVEKVYARFRYDYVNGGDAAISNNIATYRTNVPTVAENAAWGNYQFWNAQGINNQTYVQMTSNKIYQVLDGSYAGLNGWRGIYRVISNARPVTGLYAAGAGVQQEIAVDTIPAFQFAIFWNGQLEFTQCAPMVIRGRTHANGPICLGPASGSSLSFLGTVSTTSSILYSNLGGYAVSGMKGSVTYSGTPQKSTGVPTLQLPIGTNNSAAAVREIIYPPPASESATSEMGTQRFYNKAAVLILVSNLSVNVTVKDMGDKTGISATIPYNSGAPSVADNLVLSNTLPFLSLTNQFQDYREGKQVIPVQIDMAKLTKWLYTNTTVLARYPLGSGVYPNILYAADFRTGSSLHAVRLANGTYIPTNGPSFANATGLTVATPNPIYVWKNYNCPDPAALGTANPSKTFPASIIADAFTVLSVNWNDSTYGSGLTLSSRDAGNTTINAAVLAGAVYTTGSGVGTFSGGVHNFPRLLEDWSSSKKLTLNTSLVNLYNSAQATAQFQNPGAYYQAPNRDFNFNTNYLDAAKLPPGTPSVSVISRYKWTTAPIDTITYNGP